MIQLIMRCVAATLIILTSSRVAEAAESKVYQKGDYVLDFKDPSNTAPQALADRLAAAYFQVYPALVEAFNHNAPRTVSFVIDPDMDGIAGTGASIVYYNPAHFAEKPRDIDVVTHELMHVVQAYGDRVSPGWLTEAIADYGRHRFGIDNAGAGWSLSVYRPEAGSQTGYRGSARFLLWLESHGSPGLVQALDARIRAGGYEPQIWVELTGKTLEQLQGAYHLAPGL